MKDLVLLHPDVLMLASASDVYIESDEFGVVNQDGTVLWEPSDKANEWAAGLTRSLEVLDDAGLEVTIIHPVPKFPGWDPRSCGTTRWLSAASTCGASLGYDDVDAYRRRAVSAELAATSARHTARVDLIDGLCESDGCSTQVDGVWLWRDGGHLSVAAARLLASRLASTTA